MVNFIFRAVTDINSSSSSRKQKSRRHTYKVFGKPICSKVMNIVKKIKVKGEFLAADVNYECKKKDRERLTAIVSKSDV